MADGTFKPVEQVCMGDLVLSKDENSGKVEAKRVSHTTQRQAPSTLALTFSKGEIIETTAEHPLYREGDGFTPAGLLAIGNSIVTRAGPSLEISGIEKKSTPATVYNFSVEDFHTYFVGNSKLWVHNIQCQVDLGLVAELAASGIKHTPEEIVRIARDPSGKIVFLELGNEGAGLLHILEHAPEFAAKGINGTDEIADAIMAAVTRGQLVGTIGTVRPRQVYEVVINGQTQHIAVSVGNNGFIVGANPVSTWNPL